MERTLIPKEYDGKTLEHIQDNAFGLPVIFLATPTNDTMKANTWGFYDDKLYVKFANGTTLSFTGTTVS